MTDQKAGQVEVREVWAIRLPDGTTTAGMYSGDGSGYAEQQVRWLAGPEEEVVRRTETITRTPWETVVPAGAHDCGVAPSVCCSDEPYTPPGMPADPNPGRDALEPPRPDRPGQP